MSRFIEWLKSLFAKKPVAEPVKPIPQEEQQWRSPVGPATTPVTGTKAPEPGTLAWWEALPPSTQAYYPKPGSDAANTLQSRVGNTPGVEIPLTDMDSLKSFTKAKRYRCRLAGPDSMGTQTTYQFQMNGFGLVVSPTVNDPAGQNAYYSGRILEPNGDVIDLGSVPKATVFQNSHGTGFLSSNVESEVWFEVRG